MEDEAVMGLLIFWLLAPLVAIGSLFWALLARPTRKRAASMFSVCCWCVLAGGAASGAHWSWMTTTNWDFETTQIEQRPPGSPPISLEVNSMGMLKFFVKFDQSLRRVCYLPVLIPLVGAIVLHRRSSRPAIDREKSVKRDDEFTSNEW